MTRARFLTGIPIAAILLLAGIATVSAETSAPQRIAYNGRLLSSGGSPITTSHTIRFSFWNSADYAPSDTTATGAIHAGATAYLDYQETHTFTPDSNGYFSLDIGSITNLPDFSSYTNGDLSSLYLQIDVKPAASADTSYELLDRNTADTAVDRARVMSVPFALNADKLDRREIGTGSGAIPLLGSGGLLRESSMAAGLTRDMFTIDADNSAATAISLRFGQTLAKTLTYDIANGRFDFNDDVRIQGSLTVTGLINGIDIATLSTATSAPLLVSTGAGLTVRVAGGNYRLDGNNIVFAGSGSVGLPASATRYLSLTSSGVTLTVSEFPSNRSFIPLAVVTTNGSAVTSIADRRSTMSDDRERTVELTYHPTYESATYAGDGTDNTGQLSTTSDDPTLRNFYRWTSTIGTKQDYDIYLRTTLPSTFIRWQTANGANPVQFSYRTSTGDSADASLTFAMFDTAGNAVTLSGSTVNLANTGWTSPQLEFLGAPAWTAGQDVTIKVTVSARNQQMADLGAITLKYIILD